MSKPTKSLVFCFLVVLSSCSYKNVPVDQPKVFISKQGNNHYTLYRNGQPFTIKGAAGNAQFKLLKEMGGNTLRVWDTTRLSSILDSAHANDLAVIAGLPFHNSDHMALYKNPKRVAAQHQAYKAIVNRFKDHPALLMWCVGNEMDFPHKLVYLDFYRAFNDLTDMIHRDDPNHPVTTTVLNFNKKYIMNLKYRCNIDVISFNMFGRLTYLKEDLEKFSWFWKGPYLLAEWGINGPWLGTEKTLWGAYKEENSSEKAAVFLERYRKSMPTNDSRFLGSLAFFWGNKQEGTPTWFSLFDEQGAKSESVKTLNYIWTGKLSDEKFPKVKHILLNNKDVQENVLLSANSAALAEVVIDANQGPITRVKWQILKEDWHHGEGANATKKLLPINSNIKVADSFKISFTSPKEEGPYRIYASIYNAEGNFSTCNLPFYVLNDK